jgi:hypothetical protein
LRGVDFVLREIVLAGPEQAAADPESALMDVGLVQRLVGTPSSGFSN